MNPSREYETLRVILLERYRQFPAPTAPAPFSTWLKEQRNLVAPVCLEFPVQGATVASLVERLTRFGVPAQVGSGGRLGLTLPDDPYLAHVVLRVTSLLPHIPDDWFRRYAAALVPPAPGFTARKN